LYSGIIKAITKYFGRLGMELKEEYRLDKPIVLRELLAGKAKSIYACFLKNEESPPSIVKWSRTIFTPVDVKTVFKKLVKTRLTPV